MGLKLTVSPSIIAAVSLTSIKENGAEQIHVVKFKFKRVPREQLDDYQPEKKSPAEREAMTQVEVLDQDVDWLMKFTQGWEEVEIDGQTEFNRENFRNLLSQLPASAYQIRDRFLEVNSGALAKN